MIANVFFVSLELFTAIYSNIPEHLHHFEYMYFGLGDATNLVPFMWISVALAVVSLILLINPRFRHQEKYMVLACIAVFASLWIDKGLGMVVTGFVPNPLERITEYAPTLPEIAITLAIYSVGALILTVLYKVAITVRKAENQETPAAT
jgi:molybdopterin-containing oxidoreductase family membrane subunit